jgi:hypothetical protein
LFELSLILHLHFLLFFLILPCDASHIVWLIFLEFVKFDQLKDERINLLCDLINSPLNILTLLFKISLDLGKFRNLKLFLPSTFLFFSQINLPLSCLFLTPFDFSHQPFKLLSQRKQFIFLPDLLFLDLLLEYAHLPIISQQQLLVLHLPHLQIINALLLRIVQLLIEENDLLVIFNSVAIVADTILRLVRLAELDFVD